MQGDAVKLATDALVEDARLKAEETFARRHIKELEAQLDLLRARVAEICAERERLFPSPDETPKGSAAEMPKASSAETPDSENANIKTDRRGYVTHWKGKSLFPKGAGLRAKV